MREDLQPGEGTLLSLNTGNLIYSSLAIINLKMVLKDAKISFELLAAEQHRLHALFFKVNVKSQTITFFPSSGFI